MFYLLMEAITSLCGRRVRGQSSDGVSLLSFGSPLSMGSTGALCSQELRPAGWKSLLPLSLTGKSVSPPSLARAHPASVLCDPKMSQWEARCLINPGRRRRCTLRRYGDQKLVRRVVLGWASARWRPLCLAGRENVYQLHEDPPIDHSSLAHHENESLPAGLGLTSALPPPSTVLLLLLLGSGFLKAVHSLLTLEILLGCVLSLNSTLESELPELLVGALRPILSLQFQSLRAQRSFRGLCSVRLQS